jgi:hypothetical protein
VYRVLRPDWCVPARSLFVINTQTFFCCCRLSCECALGQISLECVLCNRYPPIFTILLSVASERCSFLFAGNLFRNPKFPELIRKDATAYGVSHARFVAMFDALLATIASPRTQQQNFKVRINAALALTTPASRQHYGVFRLFTGFCISALLISC